MAEARPLAIKAAGHSTQESVGLSGLVWAATALADNSGPLTSPAPKW